MPCSAPRPQPSLRELVRRTIAAYTQPGDLVINPMCGSGDVLVEAIQADRMAIGVELQKHLAGIARRRAEGVSGAFQQSGYWAVVHGDPLHIADLLGRDVRQRAALVITSTQKIDEATAKLMNLLDQCRAILRPDGQLVVLSDTDFRQSTHSTTCNFTNPEVTVGANTTGQNTPAVREHPGAWHKE